MGYTLSIMQATMTDLSQMQTYFGQLVSALQDDANNMARATGDLVAHNFQGPKAIALTSMTQNYQTLLHSHAYDRLQQLSQICKTYQQAIESACETFDNNHPHVGNDFADYVFSNGLLDSIPYSLPHADQNVNSSLSGAGSAYIQQSEAKLTSEHIKLNRSILMDFQDEVTSTSDDIYTWANALDTAFNQWQNALNGADVHAADVPNFTYDDGTGKMVSMTFDTKYEQSLINAFNQEGNGVITDTYSPETYQVLSQLLLTYPDPRTQAAMRVLMSTPTGQKFGEYYLYMGQKLGPNFITWAHLGKDVGAESTGGGFVVLNLDVDPQQGEIETAGYLVHEGVESYFDGQGIRQMGTQHADYVAEWFQGKFMQEAGGGDSRSYQQNFQDWMNPKKGDGYANYHKEDSAVILYTDGSTLDRPGQYWPDNGNSVTITGIPNPGLDPRMLLSDDLSKPLPSIPRPPFRFFK